MYRRLYAALLALALAFLLPGCATLSREGGIAVSLVSIRPVETSLFETTAELTLRITNESTQPLALAGSTHRLYLNGTYVGRAVTNEKLSIPKLGTSTQKLTAHLENLALMRKAQELGNVPTVDYRIDSRLLAADEEGGGGFTTTSSGQLDLSGLLPAGT
jgi:LEA14-like dessication related protein